MEEDQPPSDEGQQSAGHHVLREAMQSHKLSDEMVLQVRRWAEESLYFFNKAVLGYDKLTPEIHLPLCRNLEDYSKKRLRVILPRGWFKTTVYSVGGPLWAGTKNPDMAILIAQNTATNAIAKLNSLGSHVEGNEIYRGLWPEILPDKTCSWKADSKCLKRKKASPESTWEAVGTRGQVTSRHYNWIIEDDTVAPDLDQLGAENVAPNQEDIEKAIGWHRLCGPLLRDQKEDRIIVVGTRWFPEDLLEWIKVHEPYYLSYVRSCRENKLGESDENGELTFPEIFDATVLERLEAQMGPYLFRCLYLNQPVRTGDMLFDPSWTRYYDTVPRGLYIYTTIDPGGDPQETVGKDIDYNVVMTAGVDPRTGFIYVLDYTRKRMNPDELIQELFTHVQLYDPVLVGVETIAYQNTLAYHIKKAQRERKKFFRVENLTHGTRAKNARIQGLQPLVKKGTLLFAPHMKELLGEMSQFPLGRHDDCIDALSMQIRFWAQHRPDPNALIPMKPNGWQFDPDEAKASVRRGMEKAGLSTFSKNYLTDLLLDGKIFHG